MWFEIDHLIRYRYSRPVFLEPFAVRLRPKSDVNQRLIDHVLNISPEASGASEVNELDGNTTTLLWFDGLHDSLELHAASTVETRLTNPFDFLITDEECRHVPFAYPAAMKAQLAPYIGTSSPISESVRRFVEEALKEISSETITFLSDLCRFIHQRIRHEHRSVGDPRSPEETLALREGACRDLAVLYMEACRTMGLAARFVSGYQETSPEYPEAHLHAWAEVYVPGGGWRAFDPTNGLAVADRHIAVATGARSNQAAPTSGTFRGTGVETEMDFSISIITD